MLDRAGRDGEGFVDLGGSTIHYRHEPATTTPVASAPPLVFLHEGLGSIGLWRSFPDDVRTALGGPELLVYSRHGYGRSAVVHTPRTVDYLHQEAIDVLPAVLDRFGIARPLLVGHSDGASIALIHAGAGHQVAGLALIAPHVFVEPCTVSSIAAARDTYAASAPARDGLRARLARHHHDVDATFRGWNDIWLDPEFRAWNIEESLPAITAPVLLVQGDADEFGTFAQLDAIERAAPGRVTRLVVGGAGHSPHLSQGALVVHAIARFAGTTE